MVTCPDRAFVFDDMEDILSSLTLPSFTILAGYLGNEGGHVRQAALTASDASYFLMIPHARPLKCIMVRRGKKEKDFLPF